MAKETAVAEETREEVHHWNANTSKGKHKNSRVIEADIDNTRYAMDRTMNEISERFHPRSIVDHMLDYFHKSENREQIREVARETGQSFADSVRRNPVPALLIGGGIVWSIFNQRQESHEPEYVYGPEGSYVDARTGEAYPTDQESGNSYRYAEKNDRGDGAGAQEKAKGAVKGAGEKASGAIDALREKGEQAGQSAKGAARKAANKAGSGLGRQKGKMRHAGGNAAGSARHGLESARYQAREGVSQGASQAGRLARDNPVAIGLGALALGVLAGGLMPGSRTEEKLVGEEAKKAKEQAAEAANKTAKTASESARQEGLHPDQLGGKAQSVAENTSNQAEKEAEKKTGNPNSENPNRETPL